MLLYGAGKRGEVAYSNLCTLSMKSIVKGFVDGGYPTDEKLGLPVYRRSDINSQKLEGCLIFLTTYAVPKMVKNLEDSGTSRGVYYYPELLISDYREEDWIEHDKDIKWVVQQLSDSLSRFLYRTVFDIYDTGNIGILSQTKGEYQYFPIEYTIDEVPGFRLSTEEVLVDCGAYTGDTIKVFESIICNRFRLVYALEADDANYKRLCDNYLDDDRIIKVNKAAYSADTEIMFLKEGTTNSSVSASDEGSLIEACKIDSLVADIDVTFIKMDIEGAELEALKGAKDTIVRCHPKLAICIYHKLEDLWEIPMYIKSLYPGYKLYIRNYEDRLDELVLFAIAED